MGLVEREYIILRAEGDETNKWFNLQKYPIIENISIPFSIILHRDNQDILLAKDIDYLIDFEESSVLFLIEIREDDNIRIENYMYEDLYYRYMYATREILGDTDYTSFIFLNKNILNNINKAYKVYIKGQSNWEIEYDEENERILTDVSDDQLYYISSFAAVLSLQAEFKKRLLTSIYIKDGVTTIDNTRTMKTLKEEVDDFIKNIQRELTDELIYGRYSEYPFADVDGISVYANYLRQ